MSDAFSIVSPVLCPDWHIDVSTTAIQPWSAMMNIGVSNCPRASCGYYIDVAQYIVCILKFVHLARADPAEVFQQRHVAGGASISAPLDI
jgi:hypothetical protein